MNIALHQSLSIEAIKRHLSRALPGHMIPTACVVVRSMPLVPSLKIDRRRVDAWLVSMESRPPELAIARLIDLKASSLDPGEVTANILSRTVAELVAYKDKVKRLMLEGQDFGLQKAGIDSIQIISLSMFLQKKYATKVPMDKLLSSKVTIRDLAHLVDHHNDTSTASAILETVDVGQESRFLTEALFRHIEAQCSNSDPQNYVPIRNVFLTGASGYLGSAILQHLMATPNVHVFALVRCSTESAGLQRIVDAAIKTGWWQDLYASRTHVWQGDLTEAELGLNEQQLQCLRRATQQEDLCIQAIIHNGARVHYSSDYETLKGSKIHPTIELLKITAQSANISSFVFVSGGQKPSTNNHKQNLSATTAQLTQSNGYAQSKYVSEQIVRNCVDHAAFRVKHLYAIKPGYIIGSLQAGIANHSDFIWRLIAGCIEIGAYNSDEAAHWLFIADVNRVARGIVSGVFDTNHTSGHVEMVLDGLRFSELWEVLDEFGYVLQGRRYQEWMGRLRGSIMEKEEGHLLFPLLHVLERDGGCVGEELPLGTREEMVGRNVRYLIDVGFLPPPGKEVALGNVG